MISVKFAILILLLLDNVFAMNDYDSSVPMEAMNFKQNDKQTFQGLNRMLRDPGWRHIGLGKRSRGYTSGKTWAMIGLGR
jgi:type IV secretory pathway VirB10-like protein